MAKRSVIVIMMAVGLLSQSLNAKTNAKADFRDAGRRGSVEQFNVGLHPIASRHETAEQDGPQGLGRQAAPRRLPVGAAQSPNIGMGVGTSLDLTFDDAQYTWSQGRHVAHWWNREVGSGMEVSVHFAYRDQPDTISGWPYTKTGYNVYNAVGGGDWPRGQEVGCDIEGTDTVGYGRMPSMDMMHNGRVVMANTGYFYRSRADGSRLDDNLVYFQDSEFGCVYEPRSLLNVTWIDTSAYRSSFMDLSDGNYSRDPQVVTQWDGGNTIVHLVFGESNGTSLSGDHYVNDSTYRTWLYFRKVGNTASSGTWSSPQILDSNLTPSTSLAAAPNSGDLAFVYINPTYYGALLNNFWDRDVWCRESSDYGLSWQPAYSITNYTNAIADDPNHFTAWHECQALFTSDGNLHVIWTADKTSNNPYFDGYAWHDFNQNLYHWDQNSDAIVKLANGSFWDTDELTGSMNDLHCGFGGSNVGYLGWATMGVCDDKLYAIWSQIHERANRYPWRDSEIQPAPGVLDDCSYTGNRLARANWEILMSVARVSTPTLWDYPRNITNTYTPDCGLVYDPEASGPCGSEWKPSVEKYALDESGLSLTWPSEAIVDMSPGRDYNGGWYLNMEYLDDQFPGPSDWGNSNPPATLNSMKWVRLACVEPEEAPIIMVEPRSLDWPQWVATGAVDNISITVINEGNVMLSVFEVGYAEATGSGWLGVSISPSPAAPFQVTAGVVNTATFDIIFDATSIFQPTWLDGTVWLKSDAANSDSIAIPIHILAASDVEPVVWDTVMTHENMFDMYFYPEGECVALAVGNAGDLGWGTGGHGGANLDYTESELECGSRARDSIYLKAATAFTILADDAGGANAELTQVYEDADQGDETGFDPIGDLGSITGGLSAGGDYDSVYTGKFVNRDTSIAMERTVYGPRSADPENEIISFVVLHTKVYSGDGAGHDHVTIGNVCDWDVPAENAPDNTSGLSTSGNFVYVQGTDTTGFLSCQSHTNRFATEAFGGAYTSAEWDGYNCINNESGYYGAIALNQALLEDTTHYRDGTDLIPNGPMPDVWWDETAVPGLNADATVQDQAVWLTYAQDYNLGAEDTLHYWTVLSTVRDGNLADLEAQVEHAKHWYTVTIRGCPIGCCEGRVGDANGLGGDEPAIYDISILVDALFISDDLSMLPCLAEADVNGSGGVNPTEADITVADIKVLIDYLFITGPSLGLLPDCYTGSPFDNTDPGYPDTLISTTPVLDVSNGYPQVAVSLYSYNDAGDIDATQAGLNWDNPNAHLDSAVFSAQAAAAFDYYNYGLYNNDLGQSNASRRVQVSGNLQYGVGIQASTERNHLITYYYTLNDWAQYDLLCVDEDLFLSTRFVDNEIREYAPMFSVGGCLPDIDSDGDGVLNDGDHSGLAGDNPCAPGESVDCDDNCPYQNNPDQSDADLDGKGDGCDIEPAIVDHGVVADEQGDLYYPAVSDVDLDHFPDVIFSDPTLNGVFVAYGESGGGLEPPVRLSNTSPAAITIDFVDGDALPDVIAATTSAVEVLFNHGGRVFSASPPTLISAGFGGGLASDGAFGAASSPVPAVTSGYFDDDEILDLAVAPGEILLGQGDGSFGSATTLPFQFQAANVCDFDHDGRDDLAVLSGSEIKICLNDGLPTASFTVEFSAPVGQPNLQMSPSHAVADFDWDSYCDFAIVTPLADPADRSIVTVVLWGENLWLSQTVNIPVQGLAYNLVVADPDRDGNLDIVVANGTESRLEVYFGDGNGNFSDPSFEPLAPGQDLTFALATLDLDRDGNPDFVSGSSGGGDIQTAYSQNADDPIITDEDYFPMVTTGFSEASITVINPDGFVISEYGRTVAGSDYRRVDADGDGQIDEQAVDYNVQPGVYTIRPVFEPGTLLNVRVDLGEAQQATLFLNYDTHLPVKCDEGADLPFEVYPPGEDPPIAPPSGQPVRSLQPSISWDGLAGGPDPRYGFQMNTRHDFCGEMIDEQLGLATSECTVQATLVEENVYYWWVLFDRNNDGQYEDASSTYALYITDCCVGEVGNVNLSGDGTPAGEEPTIGDISVLIDYLFITGPSLGLDCIMEADVNQSGGSNPAGNDITIGDVSVLTDYLFITGPSLGLKVCPL